MPWLKHQTDIDIEEIEIIIIIITISKFSTSSSNYHSNVAIITIFFLRVCSYVGVPVGRTSRLPLCIFNSEYRLQ